MDPAVDRRQPITLPVEVWKEVAGHMSTHQWAKVSGTCRAMFQVQPRTIRCAARCKQTPEQVLKMLQWCIKHWREAERFGIGFGNVDRIALYECMIISSPSAHLQQLAFDFTRFPKPDKWYAYLYGSSDFVRLGNLTLSWLNPLLGQAAHMKALCLEGISEVLPVFPSLALDKLEHLAVGLRRPLKKHACSGLQVLHSLETLCLDIAFVSRDDYDGVEVSGLDFTGCSGLRAVGLMMLEPEYLRLPPGCSLSVTRDILWLDADNWPSTAESKWQSTAGMICACSLRANAFQERSSKLDEVIEEYVCPKLKSRLFWVSSFLCPRLTRLDLEYPKLSGVWEPIEISDNIFNLQHLRISSLNVHLYVSASLRLQTLILTAGQSLTLDVVDVSGLAATMTAVQLSWVSCCPTTLKFAALFKTRGQYSEGKWGGSCRLTEEPDAWTTRVGFLKLSFEDVNLADLCACGVCYTCCTRSMHLWRRNASSRYHLV